ncbi:MAG: carbohydrate-binding family 9-like protein [Deltaproteobacteria bacterium]|nr:carbohydrate-binding family 9-like protein [Deltaproteobacteria bacterium]
MAKSTSTRRTNAAILALLVLVSAAPGCKRDPRLLGESTEPIVDRSDGRIPALTLKRVRDNAIEIDGMMNEPMWREAGTTGALVHPANGHAEPSSHVNGAVRFLWSDVHLFVAAQVYDNDVQAPFARETVDPHLWERSSAVELMLQPGDHGDNRHYYELQIDTVGARWETLFDDYNQPITQGGDGQRLFGHQSWSTHMRTAARVERGRRYVIEMAIPWRDFDAAGRANVPPHVGDVWRANVYSFRDGQRDSLAWSPILGQGNFHFAPRFGRLQFGP